MKLVTRTEINEKLDEAMKSGNIEMVKFYAYQLGLAQVYPMTEHGTLHKGDVIEDEDGSEYEVEKFYIADDDHMVIFLADENGYKFMIDVERDKEAFETPGGVEKLIKWIESFK